MGVRESVFLGVNEIWKKRLKYMSRLDWSRLDWTQRLTKTILHVNKLKINKINIKGFDIEKIEDHSGKKIIFFFQKCSRINRNSLFHTRQICLYKF